MGTRCAPYSAATTLKYATAASQSSAVGFSSILGDRATVCAEPALETSVATSTLLHDAVLQVSPKMRIEELRNVIRDAGGILPALQRLSFAGVLSWA